MKDNATADKFRHEGNAFFQRSKFYEALIYYNKSLCHAVAKSSQLGLAYANRSAVYLEVKQFDKCLNNIQLARDNKYPNEGKLKEREAKCKEQQQVTQPSDPKNDPWTYFKLSYPANEKIPFIVECLKVKADKKFGRYIITNQNLTAGDVIAIEEPIFKMLDKSHSYSNCTFCLKSNMLNLIPCSFNNDPSVCSSAMYCDQECLTKARERFHGAFCREIEGLLLGCDEKSTNTMTAVLKGLLESLFVAKDPLVLKGLMTSKKQTTIFDYDLSEQDDDTASDFKYLSIFNNLSEDSDKIIETGRREISSLCVKVCPKLKAICNKHPKMKSFLVEYSTRLALIRCRNAVGFAVQGMKAGSAVLPFGSLYSHACDHNIHLINIDNKFVHIAMKPITKGEQLFFNYGFYFAKNHPDRIVRQKAIMKGYDFKCSCQACLNNYSMESFPRCDPFFALPTGILPNTIEDTMVELKKHFKYINQNSKNYPSLELFILSSWCEKLLASIESKSMWPSECKNDFLLPSTSRPCQ